MTGPFEEPRPHPTLGANYGVRHAASARHARLVALALSAVSCGRAALGPELGETVVPPPVTPTQVVPEKQPTRHAQQAIVEQAASAVWRLRRQPRFASMAPLLSQARAVAIFPRLIKISLVFGGEGGHGVVVAKGSDGSWSLPAFYSLGAPSVGLQAGVQATTVLLFIMNDNTLDEMLYSSLTLGASTSATLGQIGEGGPTEPELLSKNVFALADTGGAFAGISFDGYVIMASQEHNDAYYGEGATPRGILIDRSHRRPEAIVLLRALESDAIGPEVDEPD